MASLRIDEEYDGKECQSRCEHEGLLRYVTALHARQVQIRATLPSAQVSLDKHLARIRAEPPLNLRVVRLVSVIPLVRLEQSAQGKEDG